MQKRNWIQKKWAELPLLWRAEIVSIVQTFIPAFIGALAISFEVTGDVSWSTEAILAVLLAAARSGFKAVWLLVVRQLVK